MAVKGIDSKIVGEQT